MSVVLPPPAFQSWYEGWNDIVASAYSEETSLDISHLANRPAASTHAVEDLQLLLMEIHSFLPSLLKHGVMDLWDALRDAAPQLERWRRSAHAAARQIGSEDLLSLLGGAVVGTALTLWEMLDPMPGFQKPPQRADMASVVERDPRSTWLWERTDAALKMWREGSVAQRSNAATELEQLHGETEVLITTKARELRGAQVVYEARLRAEGAASAEASSGEASGQSLVDSFSKGDEESLRVLTTQMNALNAVQNRLGVVLCETIWVEPGLTTAAATSSRLRPAAPFSSFAGSSAPFGGGPAPAPFAAPAPLPAVRSVSSNGSLASSSSSQGAYPLAPPARQSLTSPTQYAPMPYSPAAASTRSVSPSGYGDSRASLSRNSSRGSVNFGGMVETPVLRDARMAVEAAEEALRTLQRVVRNGEDTLIKLLPDLESLSEKSLGTGLAQTTEESGAFAAPSALRVPTQNARASLKRSDPKAVTRANIEASGAAAPVLERTHRSLVELLQELAPARQAALERLARLPPLPADQQQTPAPPVPGGVSSSEPSFLSPTSSAPPTPAFSQSTLSPASAASPAHPSFATAPSESAAPSFNGNTQPYARQSFVDNSSRASLRQSKSFNLPFSKQKGRGGDASSAPRSPLTYDAAATPAMEAVRAQCVLNVREVQIKGESEVTAVNHLIENALDALNSFDHLTGGRRAKWREENLARARAQHEAVERQLCQL